MRLAVPDLVSNSYFPAIAAVELGLARAEGVDLTLELLFPVTDAARALRDGEIDFLAGAAHAPLYAFPQWSGAKLLAALADNMYWFLVVRSDRPIARGDLSALRDLRIAAAPGPDLGLRELLAISGIDCEEAGLEIVPVPAGDTPSVSFGVTAARALEAGRIDGFWANGMGTEVAVRTGVGRVVVDARRDGGPAAAFTFAALMTTETLIKNDPDAVAAVVRALVNAQVRLTESPTLAGEIAQHLFPAMEASLISELIARDRVFYNPQISSAAVDGLLDFSRRCGLLDAPATYTDVVADEYARWWVRS